MKARKDFLEAVYVCAAATKFGTDKTSTDVYDHGLSDLYKILSTHYSSSPKSTLLHITGIDSRYQCSSTTLKGGMRSLKIDRVYQITQFERILASICDGN